MDKKRTAPTFSQPLDIFIFITLDTYSSVLLASAAACLMYCLLPGISDCHTSREKGIGKLFSYVVATKPLHENRVT